MQERKGRSRVGIVGRPRGRPRKEPEKKASFTMHVRLTEQDLVALRRICRAFQMSASAFIRMCIKDKVYDLDYGYGYSGYNDDEENDEYSDNSE